MNVNELHDKLMAAARNNPPSDKVPYAFEKRILSRLSGPATPDVWSQWGRPLWQAAIACIAITAACGVWAYHNEKPVETADFSQDFEAAVFAPIGEHIEDAW